MTDLRSSIRIHSNHIAIGFFIGAANTIPGISGGSVAFILGVYEKLLSSLATISPRSLMSLLDHKLRKNFLRDLNAQFLFPLLMGALLGLFSFSAFMPRLLENFPMEMNAFFLGLMVASLPSLLREVDGRLTLVHVIIVIALALLTAHIFTLDINLKTGGLLVQVLSGALAMMAMLLPGISGSFVLVLLGNYHQILVQVNSAFLLDFESILALVPLGIGAVAGAIAFSNIITHCLKSFRKGTMAVLIGLLVGSFYKLWPFIGVDKKPILVPQNFGLDEIVLLGLFMLGLCTSIFLFYNNKKANEKIST